MAEDVRYYELYRIPPGMKEWRIIGRYVSWAAVINSLEIEIEIDAPDRPSKYMIKGITAKIIYEG